MSQLIEQSQYLLEIWQATVPGECPPLAQFSRWLLIHDRNWRRIEWGIRELVIKLVKGKQMDDEHKIKFVSCIINAKAKEDKLQTQETTLDCGTF
jgi:hypothetical protein